MADTPVVRGMMFYRCETRVGAADSHPLAFVQGRPVGSGETPEQAWDKLVVAARQLQLGGCTRTIFRLAKRLP